jgi:hypothetical protein
LAKFLEQLLDEKFQRKAIEELEKDFEGADYISKYTDLMRNITTSYKVLAAVDGGGEKTDGEIIINVPADRAESFTKDMKD